MRGDVLGLALSLGLVGLAVYLAFGTDSAGASILPDWVSGSVSYDPVTGDPMVNDSQSANVNDNGSEGVSDNQKVLAFLAMIRQFESGNNYESNTNGDLSAHPNVKRTVKINNVNIITTAAGAYQFIYPTWRALAARLSLPDFSPTSQDAAAIELLREVNAIDAINADNIPLALQRASTQWASLPGSTAGQNPKSMQVALDTYNNFLSAA